MSRISNGSRETDEIIWQILLERLQKIIQNIKYQTITPKVT